MKRVTPLEIDNNNDNDNDKDHDINVDNDNDSNAFKQKESLRNDIHDKDDEQRNVDNDDQQDNDKKVRKLSLKRLLIACELTGHSCRSFSTDDKDYETLFGEESFTTLSKFPSSCYGLALHSLIQVFCVNLFYARIAEDYEIEKRREEENIQQHLNDESIDISVSLWWYISNMTVVVLLGALYVFALFPVFLAVEILWIVVGIFFCIIFCDRAVFNLREPTKTLFTYIINVGKGMLESVCPAVASFLVQGIILYIIWTTLPSFDESNFCNHDNLLVIAVLTVFFANVAFSLYEILLEFQLVFNLRFVFYKKFNFLVELSNKVSYFKLKLLTIVLAELVIWLGVLVVGGSLILTSDSPTDIILASLAITFVNDIDNNFYDTYALDICKTGVEDILYSAPRDDFLKIQEDSDKIWTVLMAKTFRRKVPPKVTAVAGCDRLVLFCANVLIKGVGGAYSILIPICIAVSLLKKKYCSNEYLG